MSDFAIRPIGEDDRRAYQRVMARALHVPPASDEEWERERVAFPAERKFGAFTGDDTLIGVTSSFATTMAVPGGGTVPTAAVECVGVLPGHTRKGVLTRLMAEQLRDCRRRGDLVALLRASEAGIYGRFGYGIAARGVRVRVDRTLAAAHPDLPRLGTTRLLDDGDPTALLPDIYRRVGLSRPGMIARPDHWWWHGLGVQLQQGFLVAVHENPAGEPDGFALYQPRWVGSFGDTHFGTVLEVRELFGADAAAVAELWRFVLSIDMVKEIQADQRPLDEPVESMLTDPRAAQVLGRPDDVWVRLLDVPGALAARGFGQAEPVVLAVSDTRLPDNTGHYRISADGVARTDAPAQLSLDVATLAMLYLGEWTPSALASVGRISVTDPAALARADALFRTPVPPWCGTRF